MAEKVIWLGGSIALYLAFCLYCAIHGARRGKTSEEYFSAGPNLSGWPFAAFLTAASLAAWMFVEHSGLIYRDGLSYGYLSLAAIAVPITSMLFFSQLREMAGQQKASSLTQLFNNYFQSKLVSRVVVVTGLAVALPILAIQFRASGVLLNLLSDDAASIQHAMLLLAAILTLYVSIGGMRALVLAGTVQFLLLLAGIVLIAGVVLFYVGGLGQLSVGMAELARLDDTKTVHGFSHYLTVPDIIQFVESARATDVSPWTGIMILSSIFAFMGILASPIFSSFALGASTRPGLAKRQVWTSGLIAGFVLVFFSTIHGMGGHLLGANMHMVDNSEDAVYNVMGANLGGMDLMETFGQQNELLPILISLTGDSLPWLFGFLVVCALAGTQVTAGAVLLGAGKLVGQSFENAKRVTRVSVLLLTGLALALAWGDESPVTQYGNLALAWAAQFWLVLIAVCFVPWLTAKGVVVGLIFGFVAAFCTDSVGTGVLGITVWGGSPLTVHPALWGIIANLVGVVLISSVTQNSESLANRTEQHHEMTSGGRARNDFGKTSIFAILAWLCLVGPAAVWGNTLFGSPSDRASWLFGVPSIWAWQFLGWGLGVALLWYLANRVKDPDQASQM